MSIIEASAPAKLILCGEHAVVYGRPAIALPLAEIRARVQIAAGLPSSGIVVRARDLRRRWRLADDPGHPLSELIVSTLALLGVPAATTDLSIAISSDIPIASGMGSGAAVATALVRGLASYFGQNLPPAEVSRLVYTSEQRFHGTPSGIDNTVIGYERPIWFIRQPTTDDRRPAGVVANPSVAGGQLSSPIEPIEIAAPFTLLIGDTGTRSATRAPVGALRERWQAEGARYEALFDEVGELVARARALLARGDLEALGLALNQNHSILQKLGVSSRELDALVGAAQQDGALGAKLSGAGWGGVMLALVVADRQPAVAQALKRAGAARVIATTVLEHQP